jgi:ERCC4-related helicase
MNDVQNQRLPLLTEEQQKYIAWLLTSRRSGDDDMRVAGVLSEARVDLNPHQVEAALFALKSPFSKGVVLADEVGLGKTIEAGIVISQYWAEQKRRILIIVPATLRRQWSTEMEEKFFLKSEILERGSLISPDIILRKHHLFICSYQYAAKYADQLSQTNWDLVVIDEAHKLRNVYKNSSAAARRISEAFRHNKKLLLTATPLQNNIQELYGLVSVIDDKYFGDLKSFNTQYGYHALEDNHSFHDLKFRLSTLIHRNLRKQVTEYVKYTSRIPMAQEYMPSEKELELYDKMSAYLLRDDAYGLPAGQRTLLLLLIRKLMASSSFAVCDTVQAIINRLKRLVGEEETEDAEVDKSLQELFGDSFGEETEEWDEEEDDNLKEIEKIRLTSEQQAAVYHEIADLQEIYDLANSIKDNNKGECLLKVLEVGFQKMAELGANRKALIFTESRRTQEYLFELLEANGYKGQIVLFNGSNNDERSKQIYRNWLAVNERTGRISESKSANRRQAIVDYFRNKASIMIATEAASEGINLQFCSFIANFDLPWNPQRVEQRIGRCHRYGQRNDVVVCNFINVKNAADIRVYQLLYEKFHLFDGIFGASDDVLGSIESGVDFEKRLLEIYQTCRTPEEINAAFDQVQTEMDAQIQQTMSETRQALLENLDEDVVNLLRIRRENNDKNISRIHRWLYALTVSYAPDCIEATDSDNLIFTLKQNPFPQQHIATGTYQISNTDGQYENYRLSHPLAKAIIEAAKNKELPHRELHFDYNRHPYKNSIIEQMDCRKGYLAAHLVSYHSDGQDEDHIVLTAISQDGQELSSELAQRIMGIVATAGNTIHDVPQTEMSRFYDVRKDALTTQISERNDKMLKDEIAHVEAWADDKELTIEREIKQLKAKKKEKQRMLTKVDSLNEKLDLERELKQVTNELKRKRAEQDDLDEEIEQQRDEMIARLRQYLNQQISDKELFFIHFTLSK